MTKIIVKNLDKVLKYREYIFFVLLASVIALSSFYIYFVKSAINNVLEREKITKEIRDKSTIVSSMETAYFNQKNKINIELARSMGFEDASVSSYISKKSLTAFIVHNEL